MTSVCKIINISSIVVLVALIVAIIILVTQDKDSNSRVLLFHKRLMKNLKGQNHNSKKKDASSMPDKSNSAPQKALYNDAILY